MTEGSLFVIAIPFKGYPDCLAELRRTKTVLSVINELFCDQPAIRLDVILGIDCS